MSVPDLVRCSNCGGMHAVFVCPGPRAILWSEVDAELARVGVGIAAHRAAQTDPYEANARLMAAAPELYDALVAVVALLRAFVHEDTDRLAAAVLSGARAALAKAEGSG